MHNYVIGNCNLNFVIVIGKSITSLNSVLFAIIMFSALRNDHMTLRHKAKHIPTCE